MRNLGSINRQLNIGVAPSPLYPTRYTRGLRTIQPQLGTEDWSLDFYNDTQAIINPYNADGSDNFSNAGGRRKMCKELGLSPSGGCTKALKDAGWKKGSASSAMAILASAGLTGGVEGVLSSTPEVSASTSTGMSKGTKTALVIGGLAVVGIVAFIIIKKRRNND
jgi:LPXTG-motif cell wall-anchored protein